MRYLWGVLCIMWIVAVAMEMINGDNFKDSLQLALLCLLLSEVANK